MKKKCFGILLAFFTLCCLSCSKENDSGCIDCDTAPAAKYFVTVVSVIEKEKSPVYIEKTDRNYTHKIGLAPYARPFYYDEQHDPLVSKHLMLLKNSFEKHVPVRIYTITEDTFIFAVEEASDEEIIEYKKSTIP